MSADRVSRRGLLGLREARAPAPTPPAFSLGGFYAGRAPSGDAIPTFSLREGLPVVQSSAVGVERGAARPPWAAEAAPLDGVVRVRAYACLAHQGTACSVCSERCPEDGAITVTAGRPTVVAERCTGCGACVGACPAPVNGFDIVPRGA